VEDSVAQVQRTLIDPTSVAEWQAADQRLLAEEANLVTTIARVRQMRHAVEIGVENMGRSLAEPLAADDGMARWLSEVLDDAVRGLCDAQQAASEMGRIARSHWAPRVSTHALDVVATGPAADRSAMGRRSTSSPSAIRMGFGVDISGYSARSAPVKDEAQSRLAALVADVLADVGVRLEETEHQGIGDGMKVFLPARVPVQEALPQLISGWRERLGRDNGRYRDRLRVRTAYGVGPVGVAAIGLSGSTVVEVDRLLNSDVLRQALNDQPGSDVVALVSDVLFGWVVGEGHPGLDSSMFEPVHVVVKDFSGRAWLWVGA
jgi:hypothetical protein